jgi:hypothetical protein
MKQKYLFLILTGLFLIFLIGCQQSGKAGERALYYPQQSQYQNYPTTAQEQYYYEKDIASQYPASVNEGEYYGTDSLSQQPKTSEIVYMNKEYLNKDATEFYIKRIKFYDGDELFYFGDEEERKREGDYDVIEKKVYEDREKTKSKYRIRSFYPVNGRNCIKQEIIHEPRDGVINGVNVCIFKTEFYEKCDDRKILLKSEIKIYNKPCNDISIWNLEEVFEEDKDGNVIRLKSKNISSEKNVTTTYYKSGTSKVKEEKTDYSNGNKTTMKWDEEGRIIEVVESDKDGIVKKRTETVYHSDGSKTETVYHSDGSKTETIYYPAGIKKELIYYPDGNKEETVDKIETIYRNDGTKTVRIYLSNGTVLLREYDKDGNRIPMKILK